MHHMRQRAENAAETGGHNQADNGHLNPVHLAMFRTRVQQIRPGGPDKQRCVSAPTPRLSHSGAMTPRHCYAASFTLTPHRKAQLAQGPLRSNPNSGVRFSRPRRRHVRMRLSYTRGLPLVPRADRVSRTSGFCRTLGAKSCRSVKAQERTDGYSRDRAGPGPRRES